MARHALGFRAHIGWSAGVLLTQTPEGPRVSRRFRLELVDPDQPQTREPYHAARALSLERAGELIASASRSMAALAETALGDGIDGVRTSEIVGAGVITGSGKARDLATTLRSHLQVHVAEGDLVRESLRSACASLGIARIDLQEKSLYDEAVRVLGRSADEITKYVGTMRNDVGPPWAADQKFSALAAWIVLETV